MATTTRGRNQDRARVAPGQDHEVAYEATKEGELRRAHAWSSEFPGSLHLLDLSKLLLADRGPVVTLSIVARRGKTVVYIAG